jgi:poly-gamma-glutamate capsule biosynthesis protein CapA/YwtB (metallophosphatase superfamily)
MNARAVALLLAAIVRTVCTASNALPIYIEDNHAGTFYWLAQHVDLDQPCTLIHFDAHSDASGIFDSDNIRAALRDIASAEDRQSLLDRWRGQGAVQCFNWIEPLMPAPVAKVIWVPGEKLSIAEIQNRAKEATALLDGHLEAAPRKSGSFRDRYLVSDLEKLKANLDDNAPIIVTIDLDYFAGIPAARQEAAFARVWNFVIERRNLRAVTFAISSPYLNNEGEAHRLVNLALTASLSIPMAQIEFEPFLSVANDRSARAEELRKAGLALPAYEVEQSPEELRAKILAEEDRIIVLHDRERWENLLREWEKEAPRLHLEVKGAQQSADGIWRQATNECTAIELIAEPWMTRPEQIEWFSLIPKYSRCNVTDLSVDQVGFVANAAPRPVWNEVRIAHSDAVLPIGKIDNYFDRQLHCGSLRLRARAIVDGEIRQTPILELRRFIGSGFRAAISEQFGLPYLFGSGELSAASNTGPETNLGADCANFVVFALRREGLHVPWSDPKGLREHVDLGASSVVPGAAHFTADELERGLIVHLGTHVAAVMEDRPPLGVLDENDLVAHQLKGAPEMLTLGDLLRDRNKNSFDLLRVPTTKCETLLFGGDVMLGRSCARKIDSGVDPFAGIAGLLTRCSFAAANLECTISDVGKTHAGSAYAFRAPRRSAKSLRTAGFRALGLANNHAFDFGAEALLDCARQLSSEKIEPLGAGGTIEDAYVPRFFPLRSDKRLALLAISSVGREQNSGAHIATASDRVRLSAVIANARKQANLVACLVHWGIEDTNIVTGEQRELARWLVDHGVDILIGSHPHCIQSLDFYHGCPIAYSLGNLVFDGAPTVASWNRGALLDVDLADGFRVSSARLIPIVLEDGLPKIAPQSGE